MLSLSNDAQLLAAGYATKIDIFEVPQVRHSDVATRRNIVSSPLALTGAFYRLGEITRRSLNATTGVLATLVNLSGALNSRGSDWLVVTLMVYSTAHRGKETNFRHLRQHIDVAPAETSSTNLTIRISRRDGWKQPHARKYLTAGSSSARIKLMSRVDR
jgi:hypothetical protein